MKQQQKKRVAGVYLDSQQAVVIRPAPDYEEGDYIVQDRLEVEKNDRSGDKDSRNQAKQMDLLRNLGFSAPDWQDLSTVLIGLIVAASLTGAGWNWWNRLRRDPWLQALETARQQIKATGLPVAPGCTPRALALLLQTDPRANPLAVQWLLQLEALRYGKTDAAGALRTARLQLRTMRWLSP